MPLGAKRMRGVFDDRDPALFGQFHNGVHIRCMSAHMADHNGADRVIQLGFEIRHVDPKVFANLHQNRLTIRVDNRRRNRREGERRDQNTSATGKAKGLQRQEQSGRTRGHGQRVFRADQLCEFLL